MRRAMAYRSRRMRLGMRSVHPMGTRSLDPSRCQMGARTLRLVLRMYPRPFRAPHSSSLHNQRLNRNRRLGRLLLLHVGGRVCVYRFNRRSRPPRARSTMTMTRMWLRLMHPGSRKRARPAPASCAYNLHSLKASLSHRLTFIKTCGRIRTTKTTSTKMRSYCLLVRRERDQKGHEAADVCPRSLSFLCFTHLQL